MHSVAVMGIFFALVTWTILCPESPAELIDFQERLYK